MSDPYEEWQREYNRLRENEDYVSSSQLARDVFEMNRRNRELRDTRFINRALQGPGRRPVQGPARRPITRRVTQPYQRDARTEPRAEPRRLAFEIHDFMEKIDLDKLNDFLSRIIRLDERQIQYYDENIKEFIEEKLTEIVQTSELEKFMKDINTIKTRIRSIKLNKKIKLSIIYSLLFVANQPREFKQLYVESFFKDCLEAYNGPSSQNTLSCPKGVIERLITSMMAGGISRPDDETYVRINNILTAKKTEQRIKEFGEKWLKDNSTPKNKEEEPTFEKMRNALLNEFEERDVDIYMEAYRDFPWSDFEAAAKRKAHRTRRRRKSYKNKFIKNNI